MDQGRRRPRRCSPARANGEEDKDAPTIDEGDQERRRRDRLQSRIGLRERRGKNDDFERSRPAAPSQPKYRLRRLAPEEKGAKDDNDDSPICGPRHDNEMRMKRDRRADRDDRSNRRTKAKDDDKHVNLSQIVWITANAATLQRFSAAPNIKLAASVALSLKPEPERDHLQENCTPWQCDLVAATRKLQKLQDKEERLEQQQRRCTDQHIMLFPSWNKWLDTLRIGAAGGLWITNASTNLLIGPSTATLSHVAATSSTPSARCVVESGSGIRIVRTGSSQNYSNSECYFYKDRWSC